MGLKKGKLMAIRGVMLAATLMIGSTCSQAADKEDINRVIAENSEKKRKLESFENAMSRLAKKEGPPVTYEEERRHYSNPSRKT